MRPLDEPFDDPLDARLEARLASLEERLTEDPRLAGSFLESRAEFFPAPYTAGLLARDPLARRRHLEWFLFERVESVGGRLGIETLADSFDDVERAALCDSFTGIFEVTSTAEDGSAWMRDLGNLGEYPLFLDARAGAQAGDLVAGRIYPSPDGTYRLSRAAARHRNPGLLRALRADLERARANRRGVVRVGQREIERMFFPAAARSSDPVGDARALLVAGGVEAEEVEGWLEDLAETPFDAETLRVGVDDALGPILDRLAFDSEVDLEDARRVLLYAWEALARRGPGQGPSLAPSAPPQRRTPRDVRAAMAAFDERRRAGAPLEQSFAELEADLEVDGEEGPEGEPDPAPDFPGVVGALVTEFLWEMEREYGPERARELARVESFGRYAHEIGVLDNLSARDVVAYAAWWLPESGELENADQARGTLAALTRFCRWADETQQLDLARDFEPVARGLSATLPRVVEANRRRTRAADRSQGELFEVRAVSGDALVLGDRQHNERAARVAGELASWLAPGDRLRAELHADGRLAVYCCFPPEARALEDDQRVG